jgi:hypothetical protein
VIYLVKKSEALLLRQRYQSKNEMGMDDQSQMIDRGKMLLIKSIELKIEKRLFLEYYYN